MSTIAFLIPTDRELPQDPGLHVQFSRKLEHVLHPRNRLPQLVARAIYTLRGACLAAIPRGLQMRALRLDEMPFQE